MAVKTKKDPESQEKQVARAIDYANKDPKSQGQR